MPLILAGIANMIFCRSTILRSCNRPMDSGKILADGRPLFGANKTWKGFLGMIVFTSFFQLIWFSLLSDSSLHFYPKEFTIWVHAGIGALLGFTYVTCELPNSFLKRRLAIAPGKKAQHSWAWCFIWIDQIDSLLGCVAILALFIPMTLPLYIFYVLLGGITHLIINRCLYVLKLRKNRY
ncbi:CDP-archaeol synthase [Streptococcus suis]